MPHMPPCVYARVAQLPGLFNWGMLALMTTLILSQFLAIVWDTSATSDVLYAGVDPSLGPIPLLGANDEPYADRSIVCMAQGRSFVPMQLTQVLADPKLAQVIDTTGTAIDGFRVVTRPNEMTLTPVAAEVYTQTCRRIGYSLEAIQSSCNAIGFNVTRDTLRVVNGVRSDTTYEIPQALPLLVVPYWDNAIIASYVISALDGAACEFRLDPNFATKDAYGIFRGVPKAVRHAKTVEWLRTAGGDWRNGWYEAPDGQRWFSNMMTSQSNSPYGIVARAFDTVTKQEFTCATASRVVDPRCAPDTSIQQWGKLTTTIELMRQDLIFATNGSRYGLFLFDAATRKQTRLVYSLETFISNTSVLVILYRWCIALIAMLISYCSCASGWQTTGVGGAVACSRTFSVLPVVLLPKLKLTLCAFFTAGCCYVDGDQLAFASAWYVIYPGIIEFMLFYYSLLNTLAKLTYRRMSDALFAPTLLSLCLLHFFRLELALSKWLGIGAPLSTLIGSREVDALTLPDFATTDAAMRINGNLHTLFYIKMVLLLLNLVPLLLAETMTEASGKKVRAFAPCAIERVLALRASNLGGLGRSQVYASRTEQPKTEPKTDSRTGTTKWAYAASLFGTTPSRNVASSYSRGAVQPLGDPRGHLEKDTVTSDPIPATTDRHVVVGYELSRLGYLVYGGQVLLSFDDWNIVTSLAPLRGIEKLWNHRITVFDVARDDDGTYAVVGPARLCRVDDPQIRKIPFYHITVCAFQ